MRSGECQKTLLPDEDARNGLFNKIIFPNNKYFYKVLIGTVEGETSPNHRVFDERPNCDNFFVGITDSAQQTFGQEHIQDNSMITHCHL